jgi:hypothetical protein
MSNYSTITIPMMNVNDLPPQNDDGPNLMWVSGVLMTFIIINTALRIFVRMKNRIVRWDDAAILVAVALATTRLCFQIEQSKCENGRYRISLTPHNYRMINKYG